VTRNTLQLAYCNPKKKKKNIIA